MLDEYDVVLRGTNVIIYARLRLDRYAKHTLLMFVMCGTSVRPYMKSNIFHMYTVISNEIEGNLHLRQPYIV